MARRGGIDELYSVKVDNLPMGMRSDQLKVNFEKFGSIGDVYIPRYDNFTYIIRSSVVFESNNGAFASLIQVRMRAAYSFSDRDQTCRHSALCDSSTSAMPRMP